ncbi:MAG: PKD domain-containing protein [Bacteroidetes bacterium]|nr:PKD domain-containing protein [Bacteroidota bacterium]
MNLSFTRQKLLSLVLLFLGVHLASAQQNDLNKTVQLHVDVDPAAPSIELNWPEETETTTFTVYRRAPGETSWGSPLITLDESALGYVDTNVAVDEVYEYRVARSNASGVGNGYVYAGMEVQQANDKGRIFVILDNTFTTSLAPEIEIMLGDIRADGWQLDTLHVSPDDAVTDVKTAIQDWYDFAPTQSRLVYLFGHVPVPYSGEIYPDGHTNHIGAWPADCYYADMDGSWTDNTVNNETASQMRNHNVPGDGKFDNSLLASDLELGIGRVDFHNMPAFAESEEELLRKYILKNHAFKQKEFDPVRRALIENNFSSFAEGFGQNGLKNFTVMFGPDSVSYIDYNTLYSESYLWSYGCGGGSYTSASGIGNTNGFAADSLQTVFTLLFGSYFGDWDSQNNFLRAALASGTTLTNAWAGRPNWEFHPMAIGFPIGDCAKLSQNNAGYSYDPGFGNRQVHAALMGDPTLRMHMVAPPTNLNLTEESSHVTLSWEASAESVLGYNVYRKRSVEPAYQLVNDALIVDLTYTDSCLTTGETYDYYVKAVKLEQSASGTYFNQSLGAGASIMITTDAYPTADFELNFISAAEISCQNLSTAAVAYHWDFGDGETSDEENPEHEYGSVGNYSVTLTAYGVCGDSSEYNVEILVSSQHEAAAFPRASIAPNPASDILLVNCPTCLGEEEIRIYSVSGVLVSSEIFSLSGNEISVAGLAAGMYKLVLVSEAGVRVFKFLKQQ